MRSLFPEKPGLEMLSLLLLFYKTNLLGAGNPRYRRTF